MTSAAGHTAISKSPNHSKPKAHCFINRVGIWIAAFVLLILSRPCEAQIDVYGFLADINSNPGRVSMFDTQTNNIIGASITVGNLPQGVTIAPDGKYAYIANEGTNAISVLDVATRNVVGTISVGSGPSAVAVSADGKFAYATNSNSNTISVISYQWQVGTVHIEPFLKATWEHEFKYSTLPITAGFADISGPSATFLGPSEGHDSAVVDAGISVSWMPRISTYVSYNGLLGRDRYDSNGVSGGVRISF